MQELALKKDITKEMRKKGKDIMNITIQEKATVNANGVHTQKTAKPVICLTTGELFASCTDAAIANNVDISSMSFCCTGRQKTSNGKKFCYIADLPSHLDELATSLQKLQKYNGLIAEQEEKERKAKEKEEERQKAIIKLQEKKEKAQEKWNLAEKKADDAYAEFINIHKKLEELSAAM